MMQLLSMGKLRLLFSEVTDPEMVQFVESCASLNPDERPTAAEVLYFFQMARNYCPANIPLVFGYNGSASPLLESAHFQDCSHSINCHLEGMFFASLVLVAALSATVDAVSCNASEAAELLTTTDSVTCSSDSGYTFSSLTTPSNAEMAVMCSSAECLSILSQWKDLEPSECTIGTFERYADLIAPVTNYCAANSTSASSDSESTINSASQSSSASLSNLRIELEIQVSTSDDNK
ncbi:Elicitin [Phytophthora megakarya]|uniref:Elicitin n=1 Tax=Phytophthora megakarya TaxID=4795 RepID=A0A225V3T3_9STRA|nr:Elicitin [Phytophthora megakarya]